MRIIKLRDSQKKLVGIGLQWGAPVNISLETRSGTLLGVVLNYGIRLRDKAAAAGEWSERELVRICDRCKTVEASIFCRAHAVYLCGKCAVEHQVKDLCNYVSRVSEEARARL